MVVVAASGVLGKVQWNKTRSSSYLHFDIPKNVSCDSKGHWQALYTHDTEDPGTSYSEAIYYLYSSNIFETHNANALELLPRFLLPQRMNDIRSLVFTGRFQRYSSITRHVRPEVPSKKDQDRREASWTSIWHLIASIQNFQNLHIKLDMQICRLNNVMLHSIMITVARQHTAETCQSVFRSTVAWP